MCGICNLTGWHAQDPNVWDLAVKYVQYTRCVLCGVTLVAQIFSNFAYMTEAQFGYFPFDRPGMLL